jgi:glycerophosphoryl diester phosphodiesterase
MIVAHRGLHMPASPSPENSLPAFIAAAHANLRWVEADVWPSAENLPVVIHDPTLERINGTSDEVRKYTMDQLQAFGLAPLAQVVTALNELTAPGLVVEIKPRINRPFLEAVIRTLSRYDGTCMVQSFHDDNIVRTWAHDHSMHTAMLVDTADDLKKAVDRGWPFINAHYSLIEPALVAQLHSRGRRIGAWTANHPDDILRLVAMGIDMLITDDPVLAMRIAASR